MKDFKKHKNLNLHKMSSNCSAMDGDMNCKCNQCNEEKRTQHAADLYCDCRACKIYFDARVLCEGITHYNTRRGPHEFEGNCDCPQCKKPANQRGLTVYP